MWAQRIQLNITEASKVSVTLSISDIDIAWRQTSHTGIIDPYVGAVQLI